MEFIWKIIYNLILVQLGRLFYYEQIIFNDKVRESYRIRKNAFKVLAGIAENFHTGDKIILIHSSSVGEFEQAKPVIELIKKNHSNVKIICSFFSPSGYNAAKKYKESDGIVLMPIDTYPRMRRFMKILKPDMLFFMRYDLWPNMIWRAKKINAKILILNGTVRETSLRGKNNFLLNSFFKSFYKYVNKIFTISEADKKRYSLITSEDIIEVSGDTRYDIVYKKAISAEFSHRIFEIKKTNSSLKIFTAGSTYNDEEKIILPAISKVKEKIKNFTAIIIPHELKPEYIENLEKLCAANNLNYCRESKINSSAEYASRDLIIFDKMGLLYQLYKLADIAYVGGGFHGSIHNVMEPAVYGIPVLHGPTYKNSYEAINLLQIKGSAVFNNSDELSEILLDYYSNPDSEYLGYGAAAKSLVLQNLGAGERIYSSLKKLL